MKANKKVLFSATVDSHILNFHIPYLKYFKDQGYEVHVATNGTEKIPYCDVKHTVSFERSPFKLNNLNAIRQLKKIIDIEKFEIIHTHTPMGSVVTRLAALQARKKLKTRVIYTAHGFHFYDGAPVHNWLLFYPVEKILARYTDTLITINKEDYERAKKHFKTQVEYVPGVGVDEEKFKFKMSKKDRSDLRESLGLKDTDFVLIYAAELSKRKRQQWLIDTLSNLIHHNPNVHLLLPGKDSMKGKLQKQSLKLGLNENIHFLGFRKDIPRLLAISDVAVSSSNQEGIPINLVEAIFAGIPVVATECRGNRDVPGVSLVGNKDSSAFNNKIICFLNANKVRILKAQECREIFNLTAVLSKVELVYDIEKVDSKEAGPLRVLHIVTIMNRGGIETMLMNYYRNIDRTKIQFDFVVHRSEKGAYDDEIISLGGRIFYVPPIQLKNILSYKKTLDAIFIDNPEYRIVHSHIDSLSALPLYVAKKHGIPVRIAHSHVNGFDKGFKSLIRNITKKYIKYQATNFFGCSKDAIQFMFGNNITDYTVINNAIDLQKFKFDYLKRIAARKELDINNDNLVIGHVGRFTYQKNHNFLIEVFNEILKTNHGARLLLIGEGELQKSIKKRVDNLGISDSVLFIGSRTNVNYYMQAMDVFVLPSFYEGLGMVLIEAQACGITCVASKKVVPTYAKVTSNFEFLDLAFDKAYWAKHILHSVKIKSQKKSLDPILFNDFNISTQTHVLTDFYVECI